MKTLRVKASLIDLRAQPQALHSKQGEIDENRLSQLIYGERLEQKELKEDWIFVEAKEQPCFSETQGWHGYKGWVHANEVEEDSTLPSTHAVIESWVQLETPLPFGTLVHLPLSTPCPPFLRPLPQKIDRKTLIRDALKFIGAPYLWGGRGAYHENLPSSVDCSGLVSLIFRAQGKMVPRDAHDQFKQAKPLLREELLPGDLIFLTPTDHPKKRVTHVLIYNGDEFIEAPRTGQFVRSLPFQTHYKEENGLVTLKDRPKIYTSSYGTYI